MNPLKIPEPSIATSGTAPVVNTTEIARTITMATSMAAVPCAPSVKPWWKSRTLWCNALGAIATLAAGASELDYVKAHTKDVAFLVLVVNTILRLLTTQGLTTSAPAKPPEATTP